MVQMLCMCYVGVEHGQHDLYPDPAETPGQRNSSSCLQRAPLLWCCRQHRQGTTDHPSTGCSTLCTPVSAVCSCCRFTVSPVFEQHSLRQYFLLYPSGIFYLNRPFYTCYVCQMSVPPYHSSNFHLFNICCFSNGIEASNRCTDVVDQHHNKACQNKSTLK